MIDHESHKIKRTTLSTTVAELTACTCAFGNAQFIRGLYMDLTGDALDIHIRTDANNLVTTARTTHLPEQKDTIHMISMLRKEASSGNLHDLAHVTTDFMLADSLTKASAKADQLISTIETGILKSVDMRPSFRTLLQHKAYLVNWCITYLTDARHVVSFLSEGIQQEIRKAWYVS